MIQTPEKQPAETKFKIDPQLYSPTEAYLMGLKHGASREREREKGMFQLVHFSCVIIQLLICSLNPRCNPTSQPSQPCTCSQN